MQGSISEVLLAILKKHGVRYICGLPAAQIGLIMHGASSDPDLTYVTTRHEEAAGHMARSGRPGPVHLDIPCDVGTQLCDYDLATVPPFKLTRPVPNPEELKLVLETLLNARKPLLLAGGGVVRSGATAEFRALMETTRFPAISSVMGRGVLPPASPLNIGSGGLIAGQAVIDACQNADVVLALGCKFGTFIPIHKIPAFPKAAGQKIIQVDIDAESIGKSVPVDIGLVGNARATLTALLDLLQDMSGSKQDKNWLSSLQKAQQTYHRSIEASANTKVVGGSSLLNEAAVARVLNELIPEDAITVIDGGQAMMWGTTFIQPDDPNRILADPGMGHLGFGLPFANAAKLAHPDRPVICVTGDGALGCTVQELETAARYGLNIVVIVLNDSYWGMYKPFGEILQNPNFGTRLTKIDFAKVAEGFGCFGQSVTSLGTLPKAFAKALNAGKPCVINVGVEYTPHPMDFMWPSIILHGFQFPEAKRIQAVA